MSKVQKKCELVLFKLNEGLNDTMGMMPTVCLLASDAVPPSYDFVVLVDGLVSAGCSHFMTWGRAAEELHDALDHVLEDRGGDALAVVTTSHQGEPTDEIVWFMVNATLPDEDKLRCCIGYDEAMTGVEGLLKAVRKSCV